MPRSILVAGLLLGLLGGCDRLTPDPDPAREDWPDVAALADTAGDVATLRGLRARILGVVPSAPDRRWYAEAALTLARRLREDTVADPYPLLVRADSALATLTRVDSLRLEVAREYVAILLPWRAAEALAGASMPAAVAFRDTEYVRPALRGMRDELEPVFGVDAANPIRQRLVDLMAVRPAFTTFGDPSQLPDSVLEEYFWSLDPTAFDDDLGPRDRAPLLLPLLTGGPPRPIVDRWEGDLEEFAPVDLSGARRAAVIAAAEAVETSPGVTNTIPPATRRALEAAFGTASAPVRLVAVSQEGEVTLMVLERDEWAMDRTLALTVHQSRAGGRVHEYVSSGLDHAGLRDIDGESGLELVLMSRKGSGHFLDVAVMNTVSGEKLWTISNLADGEVLFVDLDADPALEILARRGGSGRCGQCAAPFIVTLYDRRGGAYVALGEKRAHTHFVGSGAGGMGVTPSMFLDLEADTALRIMAGDLRTPTDLAYLVDRYYGLLRASGQDDRAAGVMRILLTELGPRADPVVLPFLRQAAVQHLQATLAARGPHAALSAADDSAIIAAVEGDSLALADYHNVVSVAAMSSRDMGRAFQALRNQATVAGQLQATQATNLAYYYLQVNDLAEAERAAYQALDAAYPTGSVGPIISTYVHLATIAMRRGQSIAAIDWIARALALARGAFRADLIAAVFHAAAVIALELGHGDVALALIDEAVAVASPTMWSAAGSSLLIGYGRALASTGQRGAAAAAFEAAASHAERSSSADLIEARLLQSRLHDANGEDGEALASARAAFSAMTDGRRLIASESHKLSFLTDRRVVAEHYLRLALESGASAGELERVSNDFKLQVFFDVYGGGRIARSASVPDVVRRALRDDEAIVDYIVGDSVSIGLIGRPEGWTLRELPIRRSEVEELGRSIRRHFDVRDPGVMRELRRNRAPATLVEDLRTLHDRLIAPLGIPPPVRRLVFIPDEALYGVPWAALEDPAGRSLIDRYAVTALPSLYLALDRLDAADWTRGRGVLVGAFGAVPAERVRDVLRPAPDTAELRALAPLRNGMREVRAVADALGGSLEIEVYLDTAAVRGRAGVDLAGPADRRSVLNAMRGATMAHFTAHGVFAPHAPMRSALFLDGDDEDGLITAADFLEERLDGVQLASLAACQTGRNQVMTGSEPLGMLRGLMGAGVGSVVLAEWQIDDAATADLFEVMYRELDHGRDRALQAAQLAVRRERPHPYFWAGLTLYGAWR